ncbi:MAG: MSMEG_0565 family glycosyltransferase, partial [Actinomycetota bacterium]|nr:MSMEG_0565 family glycosyltransferase [Actinomycetota bacterium]
MAAQVIDVTVLTLGRGGDRSCYRPVDPAVDLQVQPLGDRPGESVGERVVRSIAVLGAALEAAGRFDVVHAQDCISANACLSAGTGDRLLRTVHHIDQFTTPQLAACHERAIVAPGAHVCVSAAVAQELRAGWGITARVIPNGVDAGRFRAAAGPGAGAVEDRGAWRHHIGSPYLLTVGGIEPRKGTIDLLEAWALLGVEIPDLALVIAGGETLFDYRDYRACFDQRVAELGVAPVMLGPVAHDDLPALVAGAAVFALASTKEGFGLAAMEALAAGVPVVLRDLPVLRQVFG